MNQPSPQGVRFELRADPEVAARAASLAAKETGCCSFFTFDLTISDGTVAMAVSTAAGARDTCSPRWLPGPRPRPGPAR